MSIQKIAILPCLALMLIMSGPVKADEPILPTDSPVTVNPLNPFLSLNPIDYLLLYWVIDQAEDHLPDSPPFDPGFRPPYYELPFIYRLNSPEDDG